MTQPAPRPERRAAHLLSLLPWTAEDLGSILERAARSGPPRIAGREVLFLWDESRAGGEGAVPQPSLLRAGAEAAGALPVHERVCAAAWGQVAIPSGVAAVAAAPARTAALVELARRSSAPVVSAGTTEADPVRALADLAGLRRELARRPVRVAWIGPPHPRLHSWIELATRFPIELDLFLEPGVVLDPALVAFARERRKGEFHLPGRPDARERATVTFSPRERREGATSAIQMAVEGPPPWPAAWDAALARAVLEEIVERTERAEERA